MRSDRRDLLVVGIVAALLFLPGLGSRDLWNPDEPRYAEVAREMVATGEYFVPHLNGALYTQKPPLLFWCISLASTLTGGINEVSARLPSAFAAVGATLLTFLLSLRFFGRRAAWLAAAAFATGIKIFWQGRIGQIDMLLICLVSLAVWFWVRSETEDRPGLARLFFVFAGVATLAKGPVGLLPPLLSILAFYSLARDRAGFARLRVGTGLALWAAIVLAWLVPAALAGGAEYWQPIVFKQNLERYANPWHHHQPWHYYLTVIPADFFPWSFLLPSALVAGWKGLGLGTWRTPLASFAGSGEDPRARRGFLFALCWVVVTVLFFSLSPAKRTVYILTMVPAMAMIVGAGLDRIADDLARWRRWLLIPLAGIAAVITLCFAAAIVAQRALSQGGSLADLLVRKTPALTSLDPALPAIVATCLAVLTLGAVGALVLAWRSQVERAFATLAAGMGMGALGLVVFVLPGINPIKSARPIVDAYLARSAPEEPYAIYPRLDAPVLFYTRRTAVWPQSEDELRAFAARPGRVWLFIEADDLRALSTPLPLVEVTRGLDPRDGYVLMTSPSR